MPGPTSRFGNGIADAAFRFYQRFVEPNRSMLGAVPG
ncbi:MAG: hypothetical protein KatS3mg043_1421 [Rhodothermaceae bacterium]|nr:MAG: hypothetical protein KatS3mg043_1421 [Rhodothermaceae bacterium]